MAVALLAAALGLAGGYWLAEREVTTAWFAGPENAGGYAGHGNGAGSGGRAVLYYKDPMGGPDTSPVPKKDPMGMDYIPVHADEAPAEPPAHQHGDEAPAAAPAHQHGAGEALAPAGERKPLYYRNPMGLPDTSPVPKKDPMGMDYVPVYAEDAEAAAEGMVRISPERIQMIGVRSEAVARRTLVRPVRAVGTVQFDERRTYVVSTRYEGWIERLLVNTTGQDVRQSQPLMEVYSPDLVLAQQEYALLRQSIGEGGGDTAATSRRLLQGAEQRLRFLDVPPATLQSLRRGGQPRPTVTIPSPVTGTVIEKPSVQGMRFMPGDPLYRIVDLSTVWVLAEVFEQDLTGVGIGQEAAVAVKAYPGRSFAGRVGFIYPTVGVETRTAQVRLEIPNPDGLLKAGMYAGVEITSPVGEQDVLAVPESAVLDSGARQVVLVDHGDGRFEPREVSLGERADGYVAVTEGVADGESVVVSANFLIDAESNLKAALSSFAGGGHQH
jgi:Cu(I)/Ag(I) efflux system membrane fusion protein